jgi:sec-independent protein translocase protein TatC
MARVVKIPSFRWKFKNPLSGGDQGPDEPMEDVFEEMTLQEHLEELRTRIIRACLAIGAAFIIGLVAAIPFLHELKKVAHARNGFLAYSPTDPITLYFKVAMYIAIAIAAPAIVYQLIGFLAPGLTRKEKRILYTSLPFVSVLFVAGAAFAFFVAAPHVFEFLSTFMSGVVNYQPAGNQTISLLLTFMVGMGLAFEMPVIMFLLAKLNIVSARRMTSWRRYAIVLILIIAAIITPTPDPFNMLITAAPLFVLYEVGLIMARLLAKPTRRT